MSSLRDDLAEVLRTPAEWLRLKKPGWAIADPDGWRQKDAPSFDEPISEHEFGWRFNMCTVRRPPEITRDDGLTDEEGVVHDALIQAVNTFGKLDRQHPDEMRDFVDGIHRCQDALALRIVRRHYPKAWPIK